MDKLSRQILVCWHSLVRFAEKTHFIYCMHIVGYAINQMGGLGVEEEGCGAQLQSNIYIYIRIYMCSPMLCV